MDRRSRKNYWSIRITAILVVLTVPYLLSGCPNPLGEFEDSVIQPLVPEISGSTPSGEGLDTTIVVSGVADPSITVNIYSDANCTNLVTSGVAGTDGGFSITVPVTRSAANTFFAQSVIGSTISNCSSTSASFVNTAIAAGIGIFSGNQTENGTNFNSTVAGITFTASEFDEAYYSHSTSSNNHQIQVLQNGDYLISVTIPQESAATQRPNLLVEVTVNGAARTDAVSLCSYIRNGPPHSESSSHMAVLLTGLNANDFIEVTTTQAALAGTVNVATQATVFMEFIDPNDRNVFAGTATQTTNGADLNNAANFALEWTETRNDSGFTHDDLTNPENITLVNGGNYLVFVNVPSTSAVQRANLRVSVQVDGVTIDGGQALQGYIRAQSGHNEASSHFSGLIVGATPGQTLTVVTQQESEAGVVNINTGDVASIYVEELSSTSGVLALRGTTLSGGTNWHPAAAETVIWSNQDIIDSTTYSHIVGTDTITINQRGDYLLIYNDVMTSAVQRSNNIISVQLNGADVTGAITKTHYIRNGSAHSESSGSLVFPLRDVRVGDTLTISSVQEANATAGTVNDNDDTLLALIKK